MSAREYEARPVLVETITVSRPGSASIGLAEGGLLGDEDEVDVAH
jgi:hypothetical protein